MPYLDVTVTTTELVQVEFEAFCAVCNTGMCGNVDSRTSHNRRFPQITIQPCPSCMGDKDAEIADLKAQVKALSDELQDLDAADASN